MRDVDEIILHCSATPARMDCGAVEIRHWHVDENGWQDIGYHWIVRRNGVVEMGRPESKVGAHCTNHNSRSIGVCLIGGTTNDVKGPEDNFTQAQFDSLAKVIRELRDRYPHTSIHGHSEFANKACPVFDVDKFLAKYSIPRRA